MDLVKTVYRTKFRVQDSITSESGENIPIIGGILSESEVVSPNGYRYKADFWREVLSRPNVKELIASRECLGTIEHPEDDIAYDITPYDKASHFVKSVTLKDNNPYGCFGILNTPLGNILKALVDVDVPVGVSTRGYGDMLTDSVSPYIPTDGYEFITWDIVRRPNFGTLRMTKVTDSNKILSHLAELVSMYGERDKCVDNLHKTGLIKDMDSLMSELKNVFSRISF